MLERFASLNEVSQAFIAGVFTWAMTAFGASFVFLFKKISPKASAVMLGCAAGIMLAASFWSLLMPSIDMAVASGTIAWLPAAVGFLLGGFFLRLMDYVVPHLHVGAPTSEQEGPRTKMKRSSLMILAVTLHNFPEGLACGVAFGALATGGAEGMSLMGAITLTLGIGLQNIPEGFAVASPLIGEEFSRRKSFFYGQLSGTVEIIGAVLGALIAASMTKFLPYALSFAAGAMIYVVVEEIIPESQRSKYSDIATIATMVGFAIMMVLDVALG